jgi:hypothetical protein
MSDPSSHLIIENYLKQVAADLPGPRRARADIIAELHSSVLDATDGRIASGLTPEAAARSALDELGAPAELAAAYRPELTIKQARRHAITFIVGGVVIAALWAHAAQLSDRATRPGWQLLGAPPVPIAATALLLATATGLTTLLATGRLTRWTRDQPQCAAITAIMGGLGSAAGDFAILILLVVQFALPRHPLAPIPISAAATASLARLILARRASHGYANIKHRLGT